MKSKNGGSCGQEPGARAERMLAFTLRERDSNGQEGQLAGTATNQGGALLIHLEGHGAFSSPEGEGAVVAVELTDGRPQVIIWADINLEDPTHSVKLDGAREDARGGSQQTFKVHFLSTRDYRARIHDSGATVTVLEATVEAEDHDDAILKAHERFPDTIVMATYKREPTEEGLKAGIRS